MLLSIGLGGWVLMTSATHAQQTPETGSTERVVVTGSNIPTADDVGPAPVDAVDQSVRDTTGQEDVESVLTRSIPAISAASGAGSGSNLGQSNASISSNSTLGGSSIAIHGLPVLVLLDGRRMTDSAAEAAGGLQFADVNLFPSALVKHIEVLKDGASAIYGTEAVGGVVNVILDQEFEGFELSTRYGFTEKSDIHNERYSGLVGFGDDKTHMVVAADYVEQDPIFDRDRPFATPSYGTSFYAGIVNFYTAGAGTVYSGNPFGNSLVDASLNPSLISPNQVLKPGSIPIPTGSATVPAPGNPFPNVYTSLGTTTNAADRAATNGFDLSQVESLTLDQNRLNFFGSADRHLLGDHLVVFSEFLYSKNYSQSYLNPQPLFNGFGVVIPAGSPYNPFAGTIDDSNADTILVSNRFTGHPRIFRQDADFYRAVAGFKGEIVPNYNYEVALNSSREALTYKNFNLINGPELNEAIAGGYDAGGNPVTGGAYSKVDGHLQPALDFFSRSPAAASLTGVFGTDVRYFETKFAGVDGKITAFPFNLPAGPVGFVVGGEWRHETLKANIDPQTFLGSVPAGDIDVGRDVSAGFAELSLPVVGAGMKVPGVYSLDLDAAVRYEKYDPGDSTWVPKAGFVWRPIKDIALRGTFSKSFIAPNLYETNGPTTEGMSSFVDLGAGPEQAQEENGANPRLGNIRANTYTSGIVISPRPVPGLTLNGDFFHVEERDLVGAIPDVDILTSVNALGPASPFAGLVHRGSFAGPNVTAPGQLTGDLSRYYVMDALANLGGARIGGVDFGAHYDHDFGAAGSLGLGVDGTYYLQYKVQTFTYTKFYDVIGYYGSLANDVEPYHLTPQVSYSVGCFTASVIGNYLPSARDAHQISIDPTPGLGGINADKPGAIKSSQAVINVAGTRFQDYLPKIRDYFTIDLLFSYEFRFAPAAAPAKDSKEGKGNGKATEKMSGADGPLRFFDGLKLSCGIENVTNARPAFIANSPDGSNTDASIYDPYQRQYYFVVTKKF